MSLVIHLHLKAPAHDHSFGTRACRMRCAWIGARAWAGGGAHVAALEGSRVAMYESAVCIVLSGNIYVLYTRCPRGYLVVQWANRQIPGNWNQGQKCKA